MLRRNLFTGMTGAFLLAGAAKAVAAVQPQEAPLPDVPQAPLPKWQEGVLPPFISATPGSKVKAPTKNAANMPSRRYWGKVAYLDSNRKEIGREFFNVTVQPDGVRTLRAYCEMDDFGLMRDVVVTVDGEWNGIDSYIRLSEKANFIGASWNYYHDRGSEMEGFSFKEGRVSQRHETPVRPRGGGAHSLHGDSWGLIRWRQQNHGIQTPPGFSTSIQSNGGGGVFQNRGRGSRSTNTFLGNEVKKTAQGTFNTQHTRTLFNVGDQMDIWGMGLDGVPCYQEHIWPDAPTKIFELQELEGDYR